MSLDPAWVALIGTIFGGVGLKVIEHWLGKNKVRYDDATQIRNELRMEIAEQREEIKDLETLVHKWRADYYDLRDKHIAVQTELTLALRRIKDEVEEAESVVDEP